jgi:formylglycine-generating enzyme required for sulfatase activity
MTSRIIARSILSIFIIYLLTACSSSSTPGTTATSADTSETAIVLTPTITIIPSPTSSPTVTPTELPTAGSTRVVEADDMMEVFIPAGEFTMGSNDTDAKKSLENGRAYTEIPVHTVNLDGYWIDKYEVTNGQYKLCVDAGVCTNPHRTDSNTRLKYFGTEEYADYPVIWVNWMLAGTYCQWAGRRLPTEAEWEKAARGTDARRYVWGNEPIDGTRANLCDVNCPFSYADGDYNDGSADTAKVGGYPAGASPYGALDMAGNVWEWTSTLIRPYPYDANDGREDPQSNPEVAGERVWRGGSWTNGVWWMRASLRYRSKDWYWSPNLGFRCASSE